MLASDEKLIKTDSCGFSIGRPLGQNFGGDWVELLADDVQRAVLNLRKYSTDIQTNQANTDDLYSEGNQPNRREREPAGQETEIGKPCDNEIDSHRQPDCGGGEAKGGHQLEGPVRKIQNAIERQDRPRPESVGRSIVDPR